MTASWIGTADAYDRSFARLSAGAVEPLLDALGTPPPGGRLLDAGSGTGIVTAAALERGWLVDAVDLDPGMTAFLTARLPSATARTESIGALPDPDGAFDAIAAGFAINHADHPETVAAELHRVARPDAPIAATVWPWQTTEMNALWAGIMEVTGTRPARFALPAGEPFPRTEEGLAALLTRAGFRDAHSIRLAWSFEIEPDALWSGVEAGLATIGQAYAAADDGGRHRIREEYLRRTGTLARDGVLRFPVEAILTTARA